MTTLRQFDVLGEQISDDATEEVFRKGDPRRRLLRYRPDGSELFVSTRINLALWQAAVPLPILHLKPQSRDDEIMRRDDLLTPEGSARNYELLERIALDVASATVPACYLAEQHGDRRRDFYFVTEDVESFERTAHAAADKRAFPLTIEQFSLADVASTILVTEAIGDLGLDVLADTRIRATRFEFWGAEPSLARLRTKLERRGYRFLSLEIYRRELRMIRNVPIDGPGFRAVLKEIAPMARSLGCRYLGTETIGGLDQFDLTKDLPDRYAADPAVNTGFVGRLFGRKGI